MDPLPALHRRALDATGNVIAGIGPDQWGQPTPCEGWDVRDLTNHVVAGNLWAAELAAGKTIDDLGSRLDGNVLGADPVSAFRHSATAAARVFEVPGAPEAPCAVSYGPVPGAVYASHRFIDVLVHGWDLAFATRQDANLDVDLVRACMEIIEPKRDALTGPGRGTPARARPGAVRKPTLPV